MNSVIVALATPPMNGALALIRSSGNGVFEMVSSLFNKEFAPVKEKKMVFGTFGTKEKPIDQVVLLLYPGPNTTTGEDVVEITCHGSMVIVEEIIAAFLAKGAKYASRGEFSSRAFYNGKMDLIEAEAINDLINATTVEAKNLALLSLSGETSKLIVPLKEKISSLLASLEVGIDYPEYEDIEELTQAQVGEECRKIRQMLRGLIETGTEGELIRKGVSVAIVGEPNVGKSSILNALLQKEKAIVSSVPGTTRDVVEGDISIHGVPIHLLDTAGIRESSDQIESLGIEKSKKSIEEADVVVLVRDPSTKEDEFLPLCKGKCIIRVLNKSDLLSEKEDGFVLVSAANGEIEPLKEAIYQSLHLSESSFLTPSFSNARELGILKEIDFDLAQCEEDAANQLPVDLLSVHLQSAYNHIRELLGEDPTHDLTDEIFSRFCVGK